MRIVILAMCALLATGVFAAILLSVWGTRASADRAAGRRQTIVAELVWALIPCLMIIAVAIPAAIAIVAGRG
jgi:heme/copper-type cytochrome/quinol oxidase subunit 2